MDSSYTSSSDPSTAFTIYTEVTADWMLPVAVVLFY
jgi:hypothetical protein